MHAKSVTCKTDPELFLSSAIYNRTFFHSATLSMQWSTLGPQMTIQWIPRVFGVYTTKLSTIALVSLKMCSDLKLNSASLICMHCVVLQMWLLLSGPMYSCGKHTLFILLLKVTREKLLPEVITSLSLIIGGVQTSHCMCMNHSSY